MLPAPEFLEPGIHDELRARVVKAFGRNHGRGPDALGWAPGRVNLIGEHTDYNGGPCLPFALPHATYAAIRLRNDRQLLISSGAKLRWRGHLDEVGPGSPPGWAAYVAGVAWALDDGSLPGFELHVESSVPAGAGLSSSAALECAAGLALSSALGLPDDQTLRDVLIAAGVKAECEVALAPTGGMDQSVALLARAERTMMLDFGTSEVRHVPWPESAEVLIIDTRVRHRLSDGQYGDRRTECAQAASVLGRGPLGGLTDASGVESIGDPLLRRRARHVVTETARTRAAATALAACDLHEVGTLMNSSHTSMRDNFEISCPEIDLACAAASMSGALGARLTGGGFGGCAVALIDRANPQTAERVVHSVQRAFAKARLTLPRFARVRPSRAGDADRLT